MQVNDFSYQSNLNATKHLQKELKKGKIQFKDFLSKKPRIGEVVRHNGVSSRTFWTGIVEEVLLGESNYITVRWLVDEKEESLMNNRSRQRSTSGGVVQGYSEEWAELNIISTGKTIFEILNKEGNNTMKNYIVWSPTGNTNPSVRHGSEKEAVKVAEEMAAKYGGEFFVAKLVSKSVRNNVVTTKL